MIYKSVNVRVLRAVQYNTVEVTFGVEAEVQDGVPASLTDEQIQEVLDRAASYAEKGLVDLKNRIKSSSSS